MTGRVPVGKTHAGTGDPLWWKKGLAEGSKEKGRPFERVKSCGRCLQRTTGKGNRIYMSYGKQMAAI